MLVSPDGRQDFSILPDHSLNQEVPLRGCASHLDLNRMRQRGGYLCDRLLKGSVLSTNLISTACMACPPMGIESSTLTSKTEGWRTPFRSSDHRSSCLYTEA